MMQVNKKLLSCFSCCEARDSFSKCMFGTLAMYPCMSLELPSSSYFKTIHCYAKQMTAS
uniref:Uncharacterized protein n=1 Tax=Rhizophora mucronata TaxID=61149 RepID=A0A2P2PXB7_RHIMU